MSSELTTFLGGNGDRRPSKQQKKMMELAESYRDGLQIKALQTEGDAHLTKFAMQKAVEVDAYRRELAGEDPILNQLLMQFELGFVARTAGLTGNGDKPNVWGF